jgi:hypothetical protein
VSLGRTIASLDARVLGVSMAFFWQNSCRLARAGKSMSTLEKPIYRFGQIELGRGRHGSAFAPNCWCAPKRRRDDLRVRRGVL